MSLFVIVAAIFFLLIPAGIFLLIRGGTRRY